MHNRLANNKIPKARNIVVSWIVAYLLESDLSAEKE
jgi:hypothetical protein